MRTTRPTNQVSHALFLLPALIVVILACSASLASAEALSPWWGLTSGSEPTNLQAGHVKDGVQKLTISGTKGSVAVADLQVLVASGFTEGFAVVPYDATVAQMQEALEKVYPSRKVLVSGGPGDEKGTKSYEITFPGQSVELMFANGESAPYFGPPGTEALSCEGAIEPAKCTGQATVAEVSQGSPDGQIVVTAENLGDGSANGAAVPVTVEDRLPAHLEALNVEAITGEGEPNRSHYPGPVSCSLKALKCTFSQSLPAYEEVEMRVSVRVLPGASSAERNAASVAGGGAARPVSVSRPIEVDGSERFGIEDYQLIPENVGGSIDTQAGSHPFQLTSIVTLNSQTSEPQFPGSLLPPGPRTTALPKDIVAELPAGLVGNPTPLAQCTTAQFNAHHGTTAAGINECPTQSVIGIALVAFNDPANLKYEVISVPIFNMKPLDGEPARFGFFAAVVSVMLDASVRTGKDYGVTITSSNITQAAWLLSVKLSFWGVPGDPRHDEQRGYGCLDHLGTCASSTDANPPAFLVLPTSCEAPFETMVHADSWAAAGQPSLQAAPLSYRLPEAVDGCNHLPFAPQVSVAADVPNGSTPTGLTADVHVPQTAALNPEGLAESSVRDIKVTLPEGVVINPAGADGLESCSESQIGFTGLAELDPSVEPGVMTDQFSAVQPSCPNASKIGEATIKTPLLANPLKGFVYLASPQNLREGPRENPFSSLVAMYVVAEDPVSGTLVKLPGRVSLSEAGQITATFENSPELPFEDAELHFFGGERAPLATPAHCGTYTTSASFGPWSGNKPVASTSTFNITSGPNGSACPGAALPFSPSLTGGTVNNQAGSFSPFTMTMSREDGQQNLKSIELHMPPGLSGVLTGIPLCAEAQADAGSCPAASLIGETTVSVGLGGSPFTVTGGQVFLTGPYKGAPFGLSIVNPAKAGPFDLGKVIVRAKLEVDPTTSAVTVTSDSTGPYAIPPSIQGIPLEIKHVNVTINRPGGFTFNPTNCSSQAVTGNLQSIEGATHTLSVPFQATNCAVLKFAPKFTVSTSGKTSRSKGASLSVKLTYPKAPFGSQANIARVKVDLPKQLPSRLTTLQKACTAAQFELNPANCPKASFIGHAKATTPLIPVPLEGPAIFVSHGGEAFPSLIVVLQGYGVTLDLVGSTFISKAGITSSTFKTVPDAPVGSFELTLPEGKYSALAANGNLCKSKLAMPTEFVAQNGAKINQSTPIKATGCKKVKKKKAQHHKKAGRRSKKGKK
jgi:hypothetical protein